MPSAPVQTRSRQNYWVLRGVQLISAHGVAGLSDALPRGERAIEAKGGPGRTTYRLASEVYDQITYSAVPDARSGAVLKIGRYL